jgi:hypothetical protein
MKEKAELDMKKEIKKAYVSIRIKYDSEKKPDIKFFQEFQVKSIDLKPFQELSEGYLDGILGVSTSVHNVADWFSHRECLVVMPFDKFVEYNETEQIKYDDLASLTKNGLDVFFRLFDRKGRGENEYYDVSGNIFQRISRELDIDSKVSPMANKLEYASELFNTFNSRMFREYFAKQPRVNSPLDFAKITKEYINSGQAEKDGYYFRSVSEIDYSDVLPSIERGILASASAYKDESEWLILNKRLYIPEGSQLFFSLGGYENLQSKYEELSDGLNLRKEYRIYFVKNEDIEKFRQIKYKEKDKIFQEQLSEAKSQIDKKILVALESVTTDLILDYQKKVIKEITEYGSEYYIDEETNDRYPSIFEIPQFINLFDLAFLKLNELMEAQFENVVKNKNKYHLVNAWNEYRLYIEKLIEENDGKEFDFEDSSYHKVYIDWMYRHMKYAMNDIDIYEYMSRIKNKVGSDLYRYFSKDEISSLKKGGTTKDEVEHDNHEIFNYTDINSFEGSSTMLKDGGLLGKYAFADKYSKINKTARQLQKTKEYEDNNSYERRLLEILTAWTYAPSNYSQIYREKNNLDKLKNEYPSIFKPNFKGLVYRGISVTPKEIDTLKKIDLKDFEKIYFQDKYYYLYKKPIKYKPIKNVESWTISPKVASDFGKDVILVSKIDSKGWFLY